MKDQGSLSRELCLEVYQARDPHENEASRNKAPYSNQEVFSAGAITASRGSEVTKKLGPTAQSCLVSFEQDDSRGDISLCNPVEHLLPRITSTSIPSYLIAAPVLVPEPSVENSIKRYLDELTMPSLGKYSTS